jgi:hypothetical protein
MYAFSIETLNGRFTMVPFYRIPLSNCVAAAVIVLTTGTATAMPQVELGRNIEPVLRDIACLSLGGVRVCQDDLGAGLQRVAKRHPKGKNHHDQGSHQTTPADEWDYDGINENIQANEGQKVEGQSGACPPGQTDKLKKYKGTCVPIELGNMREPD